MTLQPNMLAQTDPVSITSITTHPLAPAPGASILMVFVISLAKEQDLVL